MSKLKCPFCDSEIEQVNDQQRSLLHCSNIVCCKGGHYIGNTSMWRDLIRTRKALNFAISTLTVISEGLVIEHSVVGHEDDNKIKLAKIALDKIKTELEQKDKQ